MSVRPRLNIVSVLFFLIFLGRQWASSQSKRIFPLDPASARYFEASWRTYVRFCNPYTDIFDILEPQYQSAVSSLTHESNAREQEDFYAHRLVGHLMSFYWGDSIPPDNLHRRRPCPKERCCSTQFTGPPIDRLLIASLRGAIQKGMDSSVQTPARIQLRIVFHQHDISAVHKRLKLFHRSHVYDL